jgi:pimeloyl-ACP methyl ester carboxylesterase
VTEPERREVFFVAADGTRLFADDRGPVHTSLVPILCLPGLTRNSKDFEPVFGLLSHKRRTIAMDLRGRGRSAHAKDPKTYAVNIELNDVIGLLDHLLIRRVALIGTSRGGLIGQVMASTHASRLAGLFLNDIGAEIDPVGLKRILGYLGAPFSFENWEEAAAALAKRSPGFNNLSSSEWVAVAKRIYVERNGRPCTDYDLHLGDHGISAADIDAKKVQNLWAVMPALKGLPTTVLRGESSDILSRTTVARMKKEVSNLIASEVPDRGHVPFLDEPESVAAITEWLRRVDENEKGQR